MNMATNENGQIHWEKVKDEEDKEDEPIPFYLRKMNSDSSSVEMTGYALLIMAHRVKNNMVGMDITDGLPVVKWLASNRNSLGGYCSTQVYKKTAYSIQYTWTKSLYSSQHNKNAT